MNQCWSGVFTAWRRLFEATGARELRLPLLIPWDSLPSPIQTLWQRAPKVVDGQGRVLVLRPEITSQVACLAPRGAMAPQTFYYADRVCRIDDATIREFVQIGFEILYPTSNSIHQIVSMAVQALEVFKRPFTLDITHVALKQRLLGKAWDMVQVPVDPSLVRGREETLRWLRKQTLDAPEVNVLADFLDRFPDCVVIDLSMQPLFDYYTGWFIEGFVDTFPHEVLRGGQYRILDIEGIGFAMEFPYDAVRSF